MLGRVLVIGGGFAGLWAAAGAARALDRLGPAAPDGGAEVVLVNPDPFHTVRVRCFRGAECGFDMGPAAVPAVRAALAVAGVEARGGAAVKREINGRRIYPPPGGERQAILDAAAPVVQPAPPLASR